MSLYTSTSSSILSRRKNYFTAPDGFGDYFPKSETTTSGDTGSYWPTESGRSNRGKRAFASNKHGEEWQAIYWAEYDKTMNNTLDKKMPKIEEDQYSIPNHTNPWDYSRPDRSFVRKLRREGRERAQRNPVAFPQNSAPVAQFESHLMSSLQNESQRYDLL